MTLKHKKLKETIGQSDNKDFLEKNILDVPVWQGLRNYTGSVAIQNQKARQLNAKCRKEQIDSQDRINKINTLNNQAITKNVRSYIRDVLIKKKNAKIRLKMFVGILKAKKMCEKVSQDFFVTV